METWRKDLYLAHHGILGQRWGKKMGPPYPLGGGDHSASEKKAGWRESLEQKKKQRQERKAVKTKAKSYEKEMNELQKKEAQYDLYENDLYSNYIKLDKKYKDLKNKNSRKAQKLIHESEILNKKYKEVHKDRMAALEEWTNLHEKISNDKDVTYKVRRKEYYGNRRYVKDTQKKYGGKRKYNTTITRANSVDSVIGNKYKVRPTYSHGNRRSYNKSSNKIASVTHNRIRRTYYYV